METRIYKRNKRHWAIMCIIVIISAVCFTAAISIFITKSVVESDVEEKVFNQTRIEVQEIFEQPIMQEEPSSYTEPIEVERPPEPPKQKLVVYGNKTYIMREDGFLERGGYVWQPVRVTTTAYTWKDDGVDPRIGAGDGKTSRLKNAKTTYGIAADPRIFKYGTVFHVAGYGVFEVDDTGGAMKGKYKLDLRIPNKRYDGVWRSDRDIRRIAIRHGCQRNRIVLMRVN